ncbi:hypothetical protein HDV03_002525 [Kappamyces sp. JEL0829]|nr:hypothetical protein HDV03_002525 [Kappamyces sp. JEL0829]
MSGLKRILKEAQDLKKSHNEFELEPLEENVFEWKAVVAGDPASPFAGGRFQVRISLGQEYPMKAPTVIFTTKVLHPNVSWKDGSICLDLLGDAWSPSWTLSSMMTAIKMLLVDPVPDSPLNVDAANLLRCGDTRGYNSLVAFYVQEFALGNSPVSSQS